MKKVALVAILALAGYVSAYAQAPLKGVKDKNPGKVNARDPHVANPGDVRVNNENAAKPVYKPAKKGKMVRKNTGARAVNTKQTLRAKPAPRPIADSMDKGPKAHKKHGKAKHAHYKHTAPPMASKGCMHR
jgi:hypothetical protein